MSVPPPLSSFLFSYRNRSIWLHLCFVWRLSLMFFFSFLISCFASVCILFCFPIACACQRRMVVLNAAELFSNLYMAV